MQQPRGVRGHNSGGRLPIDLDHPPPALWPSLPASEVLPVDELHRYVEVTIVLTDFEDLHDVCVRELGQDPRLTDEAGPVVLRDELGVEQLERDTSLETCVLGRIYGPHSPSTEALENRIVSDLLGRAGGPTEQALFDAR